MNSQTLEVPVNPPAAIEAYAPPARLDWAENAPSIPISQIVILVTWLVCLIIGIVGYWLPYRVLPAPKSTEPVQAQLITVDVTKDPAIVPDAPAPAPNSAPLPPVPPQALDAPPAPPLTAIAEPASVQFALPVEGPTRNTDAAHASPAQIAPTINSAPAIKRLTFGQGEGAQPAPDYPSQALDAGEEGAVLIRFTIGQDGHVIGANVASPSRWPLLNNAALQVIQDRWRFSGGAVRTYEVSIRFKINR
jgi:protein TonB